MAESSFLKNKVGINSLLSIADQVLSIVLSFFSSILFARFFGVSVLGQYTLATAIVGVLAIATNFGVSTVMAREIAKNRKKLSLYLGNTLGIKLLISFPSLIITCLVFTVWSDFNNETTQIVLSVAVYNTILSAIGYVNIALISLHRNSLVLKINLITKCSSIFFLFAMMQMGYGLQEVLYSYILIVVLSFLYSISQIKSIDKAFKILFQRRFVKTLILISLPLVLASAAEFINLKIDSIFIAHILDETSVGLYSAAYNLFLGATLVPLAVTKVYFPNFIQATEESKANGIKLLRKYCWIFGLYSLTVGLFFYNFSGKLVTLLYGKSFFESVEVLEMLSIGLMPLVLNRLFNYTILALKFNKYYLYITIIGTFINLSLNSVLIYKYGLMGAVIATIFTETIILVLSVAKVVKFANK